MKPIKLPEPPGSPPKGVPDIFEGGVYSVIRRAVIIGNGFQASENQSIGLVRALGLSEKQVLYGLVATGSKIDQFFVGDISTEYKSGNTTVNVKVDTFSNVSTKVTINGVLPCMNVACSFDVPDHKSGKLDVHYLHHRAAISSSIGLNPAPLLELSAVIGDKGLSLGGEVGLNTASSSFTKYNAGISFNRPDFSAALILLDKGQTLKASYDQSVDSTSGTELAAEMIHRFSSNENSFSIGSSHSVDPLTMVKTRFSNDGKVAMLCQREWRPKSLITVSAEHDTKAINAASKFGIALALKP